MDSNRLFQKIFGVPVDAAEAGSKVLRAAENYPYFIAPVLFSGEVKDGNEVLKQRTSLFFPNPLSAVYANKDEPLASFIQPLPAEPQPTNDRLVSQNDEITPVPDSKMDEIETSELPEPAPLPDLPSGDLEPAFAEEMEPIASGMENGAGAHIKKAMATVPQSTPEELIFEPLHTTDYFASQGIRLSEEIKSGDKLGTQLKSFTEWLKTMKKLPAAGNRPVLNTPYDKQVEKLAEKSNLEEDVITESMADAYLTQGKRQKAIEIYEKLSLQNPTKSAFFAAKIAELSPGAYPA